MSWPLQSLDSLCTKITDGSHNPPKGGPESNYLMLSSKNIFNNSINYDDPRYLSAEDFDFENKRTEVEVGDVLLTIVGTVGRSAVVRTNEVKFTLQRSVAVLKPNHDLIDSQYLMYWLQSITNLLNLNARGVAQKGIYLKQVRELEIPLPSLPIQKQIAAVLEKADTLRSQCRQMEQELNQLAQSVFLEMFGDPAKNPKNWDVGVIGDCCESVNYGSSSKADETQGKYPMLRMNNLTYEGRWSFSSLKYIDLDEKEVDKYLVHSGDLLFNRTNSKELVGKTAVYREREPMAFAGYLIRVRTNERAVPEYISAVLNSRYGKQTLLNMCKSIVGMANINAKELQNITLPIPPIELQKQFQSKVFEIDKNLKQLVRSAESYDELFESIMQRAFSGKLILPKAA